jgi:TonB family protein
MKRWLLLLSLTAIVTPLQGADESQSFLYHVRVVRVRGQADAPGAALGIGKDNAEALLPQADVWGSTEQIMRVAELLGGGVPEAVTGVLIPADSTGHVIADRVVYTGSRSLQLHFDAWAPLVDGTSHDLKLQIADEGSAEPLIDAHLMAQAGRTTAIAAPLENSGEWLVVGVTPIPMGMAFYQKSEKALVLDAGITPPELVSLVEPVFPAVARAGAPLDGRVVLQVIVDRDGRVRSPVVLRIPEGGVDLVLAALEAVDQWRYKPATKDGTPVPVYVAIVVRFRIEAEPPQ